MKELILISSLSESWSPTVTVVSNYERNNKLKLDNIRDLILSKDVRMKSSREYSSSNSGSALSAKTRGRSSQKGRNQSRGRSKSRGRSQPKFRNDVTCWNCEKRGHFTNQCRAPRKHNNNNKKQDDDQSTNIVTDEIEDALLCSLDSSIDSWIMDLGTSFHTTPSLKLLSNYVSRKFGKCYLADGKSLDIIGICDINIITSNGSVWTLNNVRNIFALKRNLISIRQLDDEGLYTTFGDGHWKVMKANLVIARGNKQGSLYMIVDEDMISVAEVRTKSSLWHKRLGHMSEKGMKLMVSKGKTLNAKKVFETCGQ